MFNLNERVIVCEAGSCFNGMRGIVKGVINVELRHFYHVNDQKKKVQKYDVLLDCEPCPLVFTEEELRKA
jgi:hypothetical protein